MDFYDQLFDAVEMLPQLFVGHTFESCTFKKLNLSKQPLNSATFINCTFADCNLSTIDTRNTTFNDVDFRQCIVSHLDFGKCNPFGFHVDFQGCQLDYSIFLNRNLKKTLFSDCSLREAHFLNSDLAGSVFKNCNLELAKFAECNLTQVDFSTSYNLQLDPDDNVLKKARFSLYNLPGLLTKYELVIIE